ncbi:unnamed protein product [Colias eurytheme]|nr:unnamed protein product [Colias eurytheme]
MCLFTIGWLAARRRGRLESLLGEHYTSRTFESSKRTYDECPNPCRNGGRSGRPAAPRLVNWRPAARRPAPAHSRSTIPIVRGDVSTHCSRT